MRQIHSRAIAFVTAAIMALSAAGIGASPASAATGTAPKAGVPANTDISAAKKAVKKRVVRRRGNGNNAAALGAFLGIAGSIAAIANSRRDRGYYDDGYGYYDGGYGYTGGGRVYRGGRQWRGGGHVGRVGNAGHVGGRNIGGRVGGGNLRNALGGHGGHGGGGRVHHR